MELGNAKEPKMAELEERLVRLNDEAKEIEEATERTTHCLHRLGAPHTQDTAEAEGPRPEPESFLERLDDALSRLTLIRQRVQDNAQRLERII